MDTISFPTRIAGAETLTITGDAEVMQNYQAALPVAANSHLGAVQDAAGDPMIFSIGGDDHLYLITSDPGGPTGWRQIDLTASLSRWGTPRDFAVGQVPGGDITLVVAAEAADGRVSLVVAGPLSSDPTITDWGALDPCWLVVDNPHPTAPVDALFVGPVDVTGGFGVPLIAVGYADLPAGEIDNFLLVPSVGAGLKWATQAFPTPTDCAALHGYAMGAIADLGVGLYMLYDNEGGEAILAFRTLVNAYNKSYVRELTAPAGATCLASVAAAGGTTDLYVAGQGVARFAPDNQTDRAQPTPIASAADVPDVVEGGLMVRASADGAVAIWALSGETLMSLAAAGADAWDKPVVFERGVAALAPIRGGAQGANQLAFFKTDVQRDPSIIWMSQDPDSSAWRRDLIPLQATDTMYQFDCYTTTLTLLDAQQRPRGGFPVEVGALARTRVTINGVTHVLDAHTRAPVVSDALGQITLINPVSDLATPRFTLTAVRDGFAGTVTVDPAWPIYERLRAVQSGGDIPDSVLGAGLPEGITKDDVAAAISKLMAWTPDPAPPGGVVSYQADDAAPPAAKAQARPTGRHVLQLRAQPAAKTASFSVVGEVWDEVTNVAGDLWQFATSVIGDVLSIAIDAAKDALTFVVELVGKTIKIVLKTVADIFKAITYLLKALAAAFEKIIEWLGFLFGWQDIWDGHKVMANAINSALDWLVDEAESNIDSYKAAVHAGFNAIKASVAGLVLPDEVADADLLSTQTAAASATDASLNTAPASFTSYQLQHGGATGGGDTTADAPGQDNGPLIEFIEDVVQPTLEVVKADIEALLHSVVALFEGNPTMADLLALVNQVIDTFLDVAEALIIGFLDFIADLLGDVQALVSAPLEIPFFSGLYRFVTGLLGEAEDLSLVNVVSLMAAIPLTILYKAGTNSAPFPEGVDALLAPNIFARTMATRRAAKAAPQRKAMAAASAEVEDAGPDKGSFAYIYTHYLALGPALFAVLADVINAISLDRSMRDLVKDEDTPLTGDAEKGKVRLGPLEILSLVLDTGSLALGFPLPSGGGASDTVAIFEWLTGVCQVYGGLIIDKALLRLTRSEKIAKGVSTGWDAVLTIIDAALLLTCDIMDRTDIIKYFQDLCSIGGGLLQDVGGALSVAPGASMKTTALAFEGAGVGVKAIGTALLVVRIFSVTVEQEVARIQFH